VNKLYIRGDVAGRDDTMSRIIFHVKELISVPRIPVKAVARRAVHIAPMATIQEAARIMVHNGVREALVDAKPPGLIGMSDIIRALAEGKTDLAVSSVMTQSFQTIDLEELIFEAVRVLSRNNLSQLVVLESGRPWGMVTPSDLIAALSPK
jgi:predicted transcriptional regulator